MIDTEALRNQMTRSPHLFRAVHRWLRINGIDPGDVPVPSELAVEDGAFGLVIRYEAYLRNAAGHRYVDPADRDRAARENRTVLLQLAPPAEWFTTEEESDEHAH
ncbi:hypothetical protein OG352_05470 [Streptomyces sp. NBC_01485]|uniref:hypothetical protein n=1 Tax=Streptomyces sp. NBC_01485 TaxID=2903884 RepID=UPI002E373497|nr:hypothetical protein [Streptomyces sp. NBC_01485]